MKTILIPTDFSDNATHAARYGYQLAKQIKADIILCNAFVVPVEMPQASMVVWPAYEYDEIIQSSAEDVKALKEILEKDDTQGFRPAILCVNEPGALQDVVSELVSRHHIGMVVMGTHGATGLSGFLLGNHSRRMIDNTTKPLLLVPADAEPGAIKKIAFAIDLQHIKKDLEAIYELIEYARFFNAEILLTYVDDQKYHTHHFRKYLDQMLQDLSNKANYSLIYYRLIKSRSVESGLDWLCENLGVDMLAMVHRPHNLLDGLINGSHTQKMAGHISKPLLVFPTKS